MKENQQLDNMRQEYLNMNIPENGLNRMKESIDAAKMEKRRMRRRARMRNGWAAVAAALVLMVALPNMNAEIAYAMERIPVLGSFFKVVTFRNYTYEDDSHYANIEVPNVKVEHEGDQTDSTGSAYVEAAEKINLDIESLTDELIRKLKEEVEGKEGGHFGVEVGSEVITDNDRWFTLKLKVLEVMASGYEYNRFYTVDKQTGNVILLKDLFTEDSDYINILTEEIKRQMRDQMSAQEGAVYFLDQGMGPEFEFTRLSENVNFYFDRDGQLTIVFDEYEVGPGTMGTPEFTIPESITDNIMKK